MKIRKSSLNAIPGLGKRTMDTYKIDDILIHILYDTALETPLCAVASQRDNTTGEIVKVPVPLHRAAILVTSVEMQLVRTNEYYETHLN
jgi:hypothetical protein